jgi:hypothetical protein
LAPEKERSAFLVFGNRKSRYILYQFGLVAMVFGNVHNFASLDHANRRAGLEADLQGSLH